MTTTQAPETAPETAETKPVAPPTADAAAETASLNTAVASLDAPAAEAAPAPSSADVPSALSDEEIERLRTDIVAALKTVYDPEIPADIYELGLIYKIEVDDSDRSVAIEMTLTAPGCPVAGENPMVSSMRPGASLAPQRRSRAA